MPFGLTNTPSTFMRLMNHVLKSLIGFVVGSHGVKVDSEKVKVIQSWPTPQSVSDMKSFHELAKFREQFPYVIKNKQGKENVLLAIFETKLLGFEFIKELHIEDENFKETYELYANLAKEGFFRHESFLFKDRMFCKPRSSIRDFLLRKAHEGGLMSHFGEVKTYKTLIEHFYWHHMRRDVHHVCERCLVCKGGKTKVSPHAPQESQVDQYAKSGVERKRDGPFKIPKRVNDNAYIVDIPEGYRGSTTPPNLRANSLQEGEHDVDRTQDLRDTQENIRNDILVYSRSSEEHVEHLRIVVDLRGMTIVCRALKVQVLDGTNEFLGPQSQGGIFVDLAKVEAMVHCE
ncbi:hypothetical protein CR513_27363, partial [Mucuna pruriens]